MFIVLWLCIYMFSIIDGVSVYRVAPSFNSVLCIVCVCVCVCVYV